MLDKYKKFKTDIIIIIRVVRNFCSWINFTWFLREIVKIIGYAEEAYMEINHQIVILKVYNWNLYDSHIWLNDDQLWIKWTNFIIHLTFRCKFLIDFEKIFSTILNLVIWFMDRIIQFYIYIRNNNNIL